MMRVYGNLAAGRAAALLSVLVLAGGAAFAGTQPELLRQRIEELVFTGELRIDEALVTSRRWLPEFYERRSFAPAWSSEKASEWLAWLGGIEAEGLRPDDYYFALLQAMSAAPAADPRERIDFDILLTASLLRASLDLRFGRIDPSTLHLSWNLRRSLGPAMDPVAMLEAGLSAPAFAAFIAERFPRPHLYRQLQEALKRYRAIAAQGGWPSLPAGAALHRGDVDARAPWLRERLAIVGDHSPLASSPGGELFDAELEAAVRRFQERHGLAVDGIVGSATLAALNVPADQRVDQIRLNLERGRWVFGHLDERFLVVNIASFQAFLVEHDAPVWTARTQVGRAYRQTPVFRGTLEYLVFNPAWTIPPTILRQDILPKLRADLKYLNELDADVLTLDGAPVDPRAIDWADTSGFPYLVRQRPGPANPLGRVKFIFPNEHAVFLHDTPNQSAFDAPERTFSSGCIRVEDALTLTALVLNDPEHWDRAQIERAVATGETRTVHLKTPLPVLVLYWTASVDAQGRMRFLPDIYNRDARLLAALDAPSTTFDENDIGN